MTAENTMTLFLALGAVPDVSLPQTDRVLAGLSLFDWLVLARAGEPLSIIIQDFVAHEGQTRSLGVIPVSQVGTPPIDRCERGPPMSPYTIARPPQPHCRENARSAAPDAPSAIAAGRQCATI
jgi:hypothetical protein